MVVGCRCRDGCAEAMPTSASALELGLLLERAYNLAERVVREPDLMFAPGSIHVRPCGRVWRLADLRRLGFAAELCRQLRTLVRAAADPGDSSCVLLTLWQIRSNREASYAYASSFASCGMLTRTPRAMHVWQRLQLFASVAGAACACAWTAVLVRAVAAGALSREGDSIRAAVACPQHSGALHTRRVRSMLVYPSATVSPRTSRLYWSCRGPGGRGAPPPL